MTAATGKPALDADEFEALYLRLRQVPAWGRADRRGALNHLTPERVRSAATARAGLHPAALEFIAERKVAVLGSDSNSDVAPSLAEGVELPVHVLAINALGLHLLDYLQFEELVPLCAAAGRWSFCCVIAPLRLPHGTGSPVNPLAVV